ncbi:MAG: tyrosine-protein phosphatase [Bifidobacteriaceae bacterium]|jgi:protein-tyrosine phosphatase|nr:tyrosine-protein phosphatase [Bifidobacteriaceae bacterium]
MSAPATQTRPANRPLGVPGTYNFRDVGGYPVAGGGATRPGVLFRSDSLDGLTPAGRRALHELGVRSVIDLRSAEEVAAAPDPLSGLGLEIRRLPLFGAADPTRGAVGPDRLEDIYWHMLEQAGTRIAEAVGQIALGPAPALVHCTAGKDRTGVVVGLALDAIGVERASIVTDYAASEANLAGDWLAAAVARSGSARTQLGGLTPAWLTSPAWLMTALLERVDQSHGGAAAYLRAHGLAPVELAALAERLTGVPTVAPTHSPVPLPLAAGSL